MYINTHINYVKTQHGDPMRLFIFFLIFPLSVYAYTERQKKIFTALKAGNIEGVKIGLASGIDVNFSGPTGITLLHRAVRSKQPSEIVAFLLENGADPNAQIKRSGFTPLHYHLSSRYPSPETIDLLIKSGAEVNKTDVHKETPLHKVGSYSSEYRISISEKMTIISLLLNAGADINAKDVYGFTFLHRIAESKALDVMNKVVPRKLNPSLTNKNGQTAFHLAEDSATLLALLNLLKKEITPRIESLSDMGLAISLYDSLFKTTKRVHSAEDIVREEIKKVIDRPDNFGKRVLHYRAYWGDVESVELLLKAGANINAKDKAGMTALHQAVSSNIENLRVVELLVEAGVNVLEKNENKQTALDIARQGRRKKVVQFFTESLSRLKEGKAEAEQRKICNF